MSRCLSMLVVGSIALSTGALRAQVTDVEVQHRAIELVNEPKDISQSQRIKLNNFVKTFQALTVGHGTRQSMARKGVTEFKPLNNQEAIDVILKTKDPTGNPADERFVGDIANYTLIQKHKSALADLFARSKVFKSTGAGPVQFFGSADIRFADFSGETVLIQSRGTEVFFDSSNTDAKMRARNAADELILPAVADFEAIMNAEGIDWCGIALTFSSRDLKKQKAADQVSETVCVAWKPDDGRAFVSGRLSSIEFLKKCIVVHSERFIASVKRLEIEDPPVPSTTPAKPTK